MCFLDRINRCMWIVENKYKNRNETKRLEQKMTNNIPHTKGYKHYKLKPFSEICRSETTACIKQIRDEIIQKYARRLHFDLHF